MKDTMKAIGIHKFGSVDVLERMTLPVPKPEPDTVVIRTIAAGVNPGDWRLRSGQFRLFIRHFPFIPGSDVAGVVEAIGEGVTRFKVGDPIFAMLPLNKGGGYAEYAIIPQSYVALIPENLTFAQAAAVPLTGLTALEALTSHANIKAGDGILIYGASGGVGTFAVQIAKALRAHVTAVASGRNSDFVRLLGADVVRDYTREDILSGHQRFPVIFDAVNAYSFNKWRRVLSAKGLLVSVNPIAGNPVASFIAGLQGFKVKGFLVKSDGLALERLSQYLLHGEVKSHIDRVYPLDEAGQAQEYNQMGRTRGKLVLLIDSDLSGLTIREFKSMSIGS